MVVKRIIGLHQKDNRKCLRCDQPIEGKLMDNTVYTCSNCGQKHFVDVYSNRIVLTVVERADIRYRTPWWARRRKSVAV